MKQDFLDYIQETFDFSPSEMRDFENALSKPLKKTIRINTNKISVEDFRHHVEKNSVASSLVPEKNGERCCEGTGAWTLTPTPLGHNMFYIDRKDTSIALGHTLEHISGYFYVQELAASSSPYYLSQDRGDKGDLIILDMSASPGGKTTQLAEYYPNATILANEIDKARMRQLHENIDRLGAKNVFVSNYDGRYFAHYPEFFDKILLDAPCSGEGTAYKTCDALKYWNIKNIKRIAKLQAQLLESALIALKVGGELVYSTCTLNRLENEEIIEHIVKKYGACVELQPLSPLGGKDSSGGIRAWPHVSGTGGFFVAKMKKTAALSLENKNSEGNSASSERYKKKKKLQKYTQGFKKVSNTDEKIIIEFFAHTFNYDIRGKFYTYLDEIYYTEKNIDTIWENFFLYKCGIKIGKLLSGTFIPNYYAGVHFGKFTKNSLELCRENISELLSGRDLDITSLPVQGGSYDLPGEKGNEEYVQITDGYILAGLAKIKNGQIHSLLETKFLRK